MNQSTHNMRLTQFTQHTNVGSYR